MLLKMWWVKEENADEVSRLGSTKRTVIIYKQYFPGTNMKSFIWMIL